MHGKTGVVEGVDGIEVVEPSPMWGFAMGWCIDQYTASQHEHGQHEYPFSEERREGVASSYGVDGQSQSRQVEHEYTHDGWGQLVEQLEGFAAVGGEYVEEHVGGDDGVPEEVEQNQLDGADEMQRQ